MKNIILHFLAISAIGLMVGCNSGGGGKSNGSDGNTAADSSNGRAKISFSGDANRTTNYGEEKDTQVACYEDFQGTLHLSFSTIGENQNNYAWSLDGVFISIPSPLDVQDIRSIGGENQTTINVTLKEKAGKPSTYSPPTPLVDEANSQCDFAGNESNGKIEGTFSCGKLENRFYDEALEKTVLDGTVSVFGNFECEVTKK